MASEFDMKRIKGTWCPDNSNCEHEYKKQLREKDKKIKELKDRIRGECNAVEAIWVAECNSLKTAVASLKEQNTLVLKKLAAQREIIVFLKRRITRKD